MFVFYTITAGVLMDRKTFLRQVYPVYSRNFGFTLIILLLLLSVAGAIISYRFLLLQQTAEEAKITKTALQIEEILEAGRVYYKVNRHWPDCSDIQKIAEFKEYLPLGKFNYTNPWGGDYVFSILNNNFQVKTTVANADIAKRIAALLSNTSITNSILLTAEIAPYSDTFGDINIIDVFIENFGASDINYSGQIKDDIMVGGCATGSNLHLMVLPYYFKLGTKLLQYPIPTIKKIGLDREPDCNSLTGRCSYVFDFQGQICAIPGTDNEIACWDESCGSSKLISLAGPVFLKTNIDEKNLRVVERDGQVTLMFIAYCHKGS